MYGTVGRARMKPGMEERLQQLAQDQIPNIPAGFVFQHVYRMDSDPNELYLVVAFESREACLANANSPEQNERYRQYRELLESDPEWHDGEIVFSFSSTDASPRRVSF